MKTWEIALAVYGAAGVGFFVHNEVQRRSVAGKPTPAGPATAPAFQAATLAIIPFWPLLLVPFIGGNWEGQLNRGRLLP